MRARSMLMMKLCPHRFHDERIGEKAMRSARSTIKVCAGPVGRTRPWKRSSRWRVSEAALINSFVFFEQPKLKGFLRNSRSVRRTPKFGLRTRSQAIEIVLSYD